MTLAHAQVAVVPSCLVQRGPAKWRRSPEAPQERGGREASPVPAERAHTLALCCSTWPCTCVSQLQLLADEHVTDGLESLRIGQDVSGAFRPNVLTALIGETGAGKTTLMVRSHALPVQANPSSSVSWTVKDGVGVQH